MTFYVEEVDRKEEVLRAGDEELGNRADGLRLTADGLRLAVYIGANRQSTICNLKCL